MCAGLKHLHGIDTGVDSKGVPALSELVERASGRAVGWQKVLWAPVCLPTGGHPCGWPAKEDPRNYQGLDPSELGRSHQLVLGKHSGKHMLRRAYQEAGIELEDWQVTPLLQQVRNQVTRTKRSPGTSELLNLYQSLTRLMATPLHTTGRCHGAPV